MNRCVSCFIISLIFFVAVSSNIRADTARMTVIDYFRLCPASYLGKFKPELIFHKKNGKWFSDYNITVVDIRNGYIEYGNAGDGQDITQFVLYIKSDKKPVLGITKYYTSGHERLSQSSSVTFLSYDDKKYTDVTSEILPEIDYIVFTEPKFNKERLKNVKSFKISDYISYRYILPQKGLEASAELMTNRLVEYLEKNSRSIPDSEKKICRELLESFNYNLILRLPWDRKNDRYITGKIENQY